jgi:hypothetical protein
MRRLPTLATLVLAACGSGGTSGKSCQPGASIACTCTNGRAGAQICDDSGHLGSCTCSGGTGGNGGVTGSGGGGSGGGGGGTSEPGGPTVVSFTATSAMLTEGQSITFGAIVTDPNGTDALAGGELTTPDGSGTYGPFDAGAQKGAFSLTRSWAEIGQTLNINFASNETRSFRAVFYDSTGRMATQTLSIELTCGGDPACNGSCVHPNAPVPSSCKTREVDVYVAASCNSVCAGQGLACGPYCPFGGPSTGAPRFGGVAAYGSMSNEVYALDCGQVPKATATDASGTYAFDSEGCCCY